MFSRLLFQVAVVIRPQTHLINKSNLFSTNFNKHAALNKLKKKNNLKLLFTKNAANFKIKQIAFKTKTRKIANEINENSYNIFKK